ncbi:MAG: sensor histidine kinase [Lachnospiraceae bacterium]
MSSVVSKIRKWQKEFTEKFRLSLSVRISLNYLRFLLINGLLFFGILIFLYLSGDFREMRQTVDQMIVRMEAGSAAFASYITEERPKDICVQLAVPNIESGEHQETAEISLYSNTREELWAYSYAFDYCYLKRQNGEWKFFIKETESVFYDRTEYTAYFYYDLSATMEKLTVFLLQAGLVYLFLMLFVLVESRQDNKRIFQPVRELTETARTLTVNNLHSERLPIHGTTTELRDLAEVFNEMLDRLELSYESQKQFVSNASHELRTPIAVIQGYIGMLARWGAQDPDILNEAIDAIGSESKAMQELVEKLLFLSRHDKKTLKLQKQLFSMGEVVEDMVKETRMVTTERVVKAQVIQNVKVYGDPQSLKQAVRIFIDNAIKYSNQGDTITIACEDRYGDCVITVADTGIGMKKEDVNHMFDRFFRSDDVRDRKIEGHGLGLSIARLIILAHAGTIKVRTQYTKGTSITIILPKQRYLPEEVRKEGAKA